MRRLAILLIVALTTVSAVAETVVDCNFDTFTYCNMSTGSLWQIDPTGGVGGTPAPKLHVTVGGTPNKEIAKNLIAYNTNAVHYEFDVKISGTPSGGSKFVKVFGRTTVPGSNWNNVTMGIHHVAWNINEFSYYGDTVKTIRLDGTLGGKPPDTPVIHTSTSAVDLGNDGQWHHIKGMIDRGGFGQKNGEFKLSVDDVLRLHATEVDANPDDGTVSEYFDRIELGGYVNETQFTGTPWTMWLDNVYIGTTERGDEEPSTLPICSDGFPWELFRPAIGSGPNGKETIQQME